MSSYRVSWNIINESCLPQWCELYLPIVTYTMMSMMTWIFTCTLSMMTVLVTFNVPGVRRVPAQRGSYHWRHVRADRYFFTEMSIWLNNANISREFAQFTRECSRFSGKSYIASYQLWDAVFWLCSPQTSYSCTECQRLHSSNPVEKLQEGCWETGWWWWLHYKPYK